MNNIKKNIGKIIFPLANDLFVRGEFLSKQGWKCPVVLYELCEKSVYFEGQDREYMYSLKKEACKERISKGCYESKLIAKERDKAEKRFKKSNLYWDLRINVYDKNVEKARSTRREEFLKFFSATKKELELQKEKEFLEHGLTVTDYFSSVSKKNIFTDYIKDYLSILLHDIEVFLDVGKSNNKIFVWKKVVGGKYYIGLVFDSQRSCDAMVKQDSISGNIDLSFFISEVDFFDKQKSYLPQDNYNTLPEYWFPISFPPFGPVYQEYNSYNSLIVGLNAYVDMFKCFFLTTESEMVKALK